jgi:hypothetical protein
MTQYNAITNPEIAAGAPPDADIFRRLRDNPRAVCEGDATVPDPKRILIDGQGNPGPAPAARPIIAHPDGAYMEDQIADTALRVFLTSYGVGSHTFVAPRSGTYRFTLWSGAGGGAVLVTGRPGYAGGVAWWSADLALGDEVEIAVGAGGGNDSAGQQSTASHGPWSVIITGGAKGGPTGGAGRVISSGLTGVVAQDGSGSAFAIGSLSTLGGNPNNLSVGGYPGTPSSSGDNGGCLVEWG